jgi:hypothetical protein
MKKICTMALLLVAIFFSVTHGTFAQSTVTGDLAGVVTDPTGASVANAKVTVKADATGETYTATTNGTGQFRVSLLRPGSYTVVVNATGFQTYTTGTQVSLGQVVPLTVELGLQTQSQSVNVTEAAPLLQNENANLATTYNALQLENLPAPGNDMTAYAFTTPGITVSTGAGYGNFSAFGLPGVSNLFTINGNDNMDPYLNLNNSGASNLTLGANEISEAAVVLNGYTGQYGRQAGAQVNYITKSGTNQFHGNAAWFWNGSKLNANDWFNNASDPFTPRPHAVSNEWADSIGGPIIKNKLFFFFDNEGLRYVLPSGGPVYIPTSDFASYVQSNLQATNSAALPFYQQAFKLYAGSSGAGRARPLTAADDAALGCGDFTGGGFGVTRPCASVFQASVNNLNTEWLMAIRGDYNISSTDRIYLRYNQDHGIQATGTDPINPAFNSNSIQPSYGGQVGWTKTLGATMVNQLLLSASYYTAIFGPPNIQNALSTFPTTWAFNDGVFSIPQYAPNSLGGDDSNFPQGRKVRQWQLIDDFSKMWRSHNFKFGANVRKNWVSSYAYGPLTSGLFTFNSMTDFVNGQLTTDGGSTYTQKFSQVGAENLTMYSAGFYLQDEWRVRPTFMLTLALRFDRNSNIQCGANCFNEFGTTFQQADHTATTPYNAVIKTGLNQAFPSVEKVVPTPRVGFAWNVTKSTVIRGGVGLFTDLYQGLIADRFFTNSPAVATFTTSSGLVALNNPNSAFAIVANSARAFQNGFASGATLAQLQASVPGFSKPNFDAVENELLNPKFLEWNFEVQQSFTNKYMLSVNYVGNHGYDLTNQSVLLNAASSKNFAGLPATAPDPRFGEVRQLTNNGWSNYDGLVTSFRWRMASNFVGGFSYTWSHALDTCSNECLEPFNALTAVSLRYQINPTNQALNYSSADYDTRHSIGANYVYTLPTSYFHNGLMKSVLGGWTAAGTFFYKTGYPFSVLDTGVRGAQSVVNASGLATTPQLADWLGGSSGYPSCTTPNSPCYSKSLFSSAANQHDLGNIPRNSFRGPGYFDTDLNITKTFAVHERYKLTVGAFLFNVLNHPNFDLPVNNLALGTFGTIQGTVSAPTSAYGSFQGAAVSGRVVQTQIKFTF